MKRKMMLGMGVVLLAVALACAIEMEGIIFSDDPSPEEVERTKMSALMTDVAGTWQAEPGSSSADGAPVAETAAPTARADAAAALPQDGAETKTYSVQATNYDCICTVSGDVQTTFNFKEDTVEILDNEGGATVFTKTGANTYSRSFMGYYILVDQAGNSTEVDEEKRVVITFTDTGYIMEHYSGDAGSPCCVHTFTNK